MRCSRVRGNRPRARVTESRPRRVRHVPSCLELCPWACVRRIEQSIDTDREVSSTHRAPVRVGCAAVRCSREHTSRSSADHKKCAGVILQDYHRPAPVQYRVMGSRAWLEGRVRPQSSGCPPHHAGIYLFYRRSELGRPQKVCHVMSFQPRLKRARFHRRTRVGLGAARAKLDPATPVLDDG